MTTLMGYADQVSVAPGETAQFMVSCDGAPRYRADIVRLIHPDGGPEAPPFLEEVVATAVNSDYEARVQEILIGSYGEIPASPQFNALESFTVQAMVWPTRPGRGRQALLGTWSEAEQTGFGIGLDEAGALELRLGGGPGQVATLSTGVPLMVRKWYFVAAAFDAASGTMRLVQEPLGGSMFHNAAPTTVEGRTDLRPKAGAGPFLIAASHGGDADGRLRTTAHYNGKIDRPRLANRALDRAEMATLAEAVPTAGMASSTVAAWDFSCDISSERIHDTSPNCLHGHTVNLPTRAVTGHNWTGEVMNWQAAPAQYGAIHFHEDDIYDAGWRPDFSLTVPSEMKSGAYAARLTAGEGTDAAEYYIPFFVRPPRGKAAAKVAYLAATATYNAYYNNVGRFTAPLTELYQGRITVMDATDMLPLDHPELGLSTYDRHRDGSGVCYSSRLRPASNIRPKGRLWNYCPDLFVVGWLEHCGVDYDVITDEDLHQEGLDLLRPYSVVATGSHPEYYSKAMLDGLDAWTRRGGRLMYLGGNGFYWRIAYHPTLPGVMEVRRTEDGTRAWIAEVGEYYMSFSGEYGGMWRRQKRPPNHIAGVGFISQGFDASAPYRRTAAAADSRVSFIFDGVEDDMLGDFGAMLGGAAGLELDCYDAKLGSPPHALVVASSENHSNVYELVAEEVAVSHNATDATQNPEIRADMAFFETPGGGAVFSTGSIAYVGSLGYNGFDNNIARLTTNVLNRFLDPEPFEMPPQAM